MQGVTPISGDGLNTFEQTCDLASQLQSFVGTAGMQVYLRGINSVGDGGQGVFYWNASGNANDGRNNFQPSGAATGTWTRLSADGVSGQLPGTNTNDNANAGNVGEYISATVLVANAVSLTTATPANIASISLTAGDWDVWGNVVFALGSGATATDAEAWTSQTSATKPTLPNNGAFSEVSGSSSAAGTIVLSAGHQRISIAATTTIYISCVATFTGGTASGYGFIGARRRR